MIIINEAWKITLDKYSIRVLKSYQIWDGFFVLAKLNEGRRSSATLTGMKQHQSEKDRKDAYF